MKAIHVFMNVDMRMGHDGLTEFAKSKKVNLTDLDTETACLFVSNNRTRMKCYSYNGVLSYLRSPAANRPFDLSAVDEFAKAFDKKGVLKYEKALKAKLERDLRL